MYYLAVEISHRSVPALGIQLEIGASFNMTYVRPIMIDNET